MNLEGTAHGKLAFHESTIDAFSTNTEDSGIHRINVDARTVDKFYNASTASNPCPGTHGITYSQINNRVYFECTSSTGTQEFDVASESMLTRWPFKGQSYSTSNRQYIFILNSVDYQVHILEALPGSTKQWPDMNLLTVGAPSRAVFLKTDSSYRAYVSFRTNSSIASIDIASYIAGINVVPVFIEAGGHNGTYRNMALGENWLATLSASDSGIGIINTKTNQAAGVVRGIPNAQQILWAKSTIVNAGIVSTPTIFFIALLFMVAFL